AEGGGGLGRQRRAGGDHGAQAGEGVAGKVGGGEHAQQRGHGGKDGGAVARGECGEGVRQGQVGADDGGALGEQGHDEVAEPVGVAEGDDGEVQVVGADVHAGADLAAVGEHLRVG